MDEGVKIYGLCLERLRHQIRGAKQRSDETIQEERILLESYTTGDIDDIIDILEIYDIEEKTREQLTEKLDDLAYTVTVLVGETLSFGYSEEGHLGLYLTVTRGPEIIGAEELETAAVSRG